MDPTFSQRNVSITVTEEYEHNLVTIEPSDMEIEKAEETRLAVIAEEEASLEKAKKEAEKLKRKGTNKLSNMTSQEEDKNAEDIEAGEESKKGSEKDDQEDD